MIYIESDNKAPFNLALEEYAVNALARDNDIVMLWRNQPAIIIGRNQNAVKEINNEYVRDKGIDIVRRLSGGGAVYHDLGNLNYTFVTRARGEGGIDFVSFCEPIIKALASFGVTAQVGGRNDIVVDGRKVCGNAQYTHDGLTMHHGCILFDADLSVLSKALRPDETKLKSKGVSSVSSRVANLCEYLPSGVGIDEFKNKLIEILGESQEIKRYELTADDVAAVNELVSQRYGLWEWNIGSSPSYEIERSAYYQGVGKIEVSMSICHGVIEDIKITGDFFGNKEISELEKKLRGVPVGREQVEQRLNEINPDDYIANIDNKTLSGLLVP